MSPNIILDIDNGYQYDIKFIWDEIEISEKTRKEIQIRFFDKAQSFDNIEEGALYLEQKVIKLQNYIVGILKQCGSEEFIKNILKFLDIISPFYTKEKEMREKYGNSVCKCFENILQNNRKICQGLISSISLWIENALCLDLIKQENYKDLICNKDLLYILSLYEEISSTFSILKSCKSYKLTPKFEALEILMDITTPVHIRLHFPKVFTSGSTSGNLREDEDYELLKYANASLFGKGFKEEFDFEFFSYLQLLETFLSKNTEEFYYRDFSKCITELFGNGNQPVNNFFVLDSSKVKNDLEKGDSLIWKMECTKNRPTLFPFIKIAGKCYVSKQLIYIARERWCNYFLNGGVPYVNIKDKLCRSIQEYNNEFGNKLQRKIIKILRDWNKSSLIKNEIECGEIFGPVGKNKGDVDVLCYIKETNEIYFIESKYFSNSFYSSSMLNDYDKIFKGDKSYHNKFLWKCNLALNYPDKLIKFLNHKGELKIFFLLVTSKSIQIELQDENKIVTFLPIEKLRDFLDGEFSDNEKNEHVKPFMLINSSKS